MEHARAICGACRSATFVVPSLITLCHTVFICTVQSSKAGNAFTDSCVGGPLMTDPAERDGVVQILQDMEREHSWPTAWIVNSLQDEWSIG